MQAVDPERVMSEENENIENIASASRQIVVNGPMYSRDEEEERQMRYLQEKTMMMSRPLVSW